MYIDGFEQANEFMERFDAKKTQGRCGKGWEEGGGGKCKRSKRRGRDLGMMALGAGGLLGAQVVGGTAVNMAALAQLEKEMKKVGETEEGRAALAEVEKAARYAEEMQKAQRANKKKGKR